MVDDVMVQRLSPLDQRLAGLEDQVSSMAARMEEMSDHLDHRLEAVRAISAAHFDRIPELRARLLAARATEAYERILSEREPLISVRIATYNRAELLLERAIPSVLAQTYERFEVVIVGDGCTDDTDDRIRRLGDPRVRFVNLPHRTPYPEDPHQRWLVAGSHPMNVAAQLAKGSWIAPNDDDDEFTVDHLERLLTTALDGSFEMAYGKYWVPERPGMEAHARGLYPPQYGAFNFQTALYMSPLRFFEWEPDSWVLGEPGDWNLCRRMLKAGVRMGFVDDVVITVDQTGPRNRGGD